MDAKLRPPPSGDDASHLGSLSADADRKSDKEEIETIVSIATNLDNKAIRIVTVDASSGRSSDRFSIELDPVTA